MGNIIIYIIDIYNSLMMSTNIMQRVRVIMFIKYKVSIKDPVDEIA